jgi:hypothetical protein
MFLTYLTLLFENRYSCQSVLKTLLYLTNISAQLTKNISINSGGSPHLPKFDIFKNTVKKQLSQRKAYLEECITGLFAI